MSDTFEKQRLLHRAVGVCEVARLHLAGRDLQPIVGKGYEDVIWDELRPALTEVWPRHPARKDVENLDAFLAEVASKCLEAARELDQDSGFVPAANYSSYSIGVLFEHLQLEVDVIAGGVETEELWEAFAGFEPTEPLSDLVEAGLRIKLRAIGAFLTAAPRNYPDEITASEFFPAGNWENIRDGEIAQRVIADQQPVHKQVAHLTLTRPFPEDRRVYTPSSYSEYLADVMVLLNQFTNAVHPEFLPDGWTEWLRKRTSRTT